MVTRCLLVVIIGASERAAGSSEIVTGSSERSAGSIVLIMG
jgi:hypothetical protein